MDETDLHWLAGLLEGEGSFLAPMPSDPRRPSIAIQMTDEDVIARVAALMGVSYHRSGTAQRYLTNGWKVPFTVRFRGFPAVRLMRQVYPLMGQRRQAQINRALTGYQEPTRRISEPSAQELARRYHAGERRPTALAREFGGISKNLAIYYINKYAPS